MRGKTHTDFIQVAACLAAEETLLDQMHFVSSQEAYSVFLTRLEPPPRPTSSFATRC